MSAFIEWLGQAAFTLSLFWFLWLLVDAKVRQPYRRHKAAVTKRRAAKARKRSRARRPVKVKM